MEALRQQGIGLRGAFPPAGPAPGPWEQEVSVRVGADFVVPQHALKTCMELLQLASF